MFSLILSIAAAVFLAVFALLVILRHRTIPGIALTVSMLLLAGIEISNQISLNSFTGHSHYAWAKILFESFLPVTLLLFSITYARGKPLRSVSTIWWVLITFATCLPASLLFFQLDEFFISPDFPFEKILFLGDVGYWFYIALMVSLILALMNIEATFSSTSGLDRWRIKFEVTGILSILAVMVFYFSQGLLYRTINMNLMPIRSGVFIIGAGFAIYSKIAREKRAQVAVSRYIFYRSLSLLIVGMYLLALGLIGEGMKYLGIPFGRQMTIFLAFAGGMLILLILLSEELRRKTKVFINKHFYRHKYDYREEWLKFTDNLAGCRSFDQAQQTTLSAFRETFNLGFASLYLLNREKKRYLPVSPPTLKGVLTLNESSGLIDYFRERGRVFNASDNENTLSEDETLFVKENKADLIVPLLFNKNVEGFIILEGEPARFNYEDYDLMKMLARQAALSIISFKFAEELSEIKEIAALGRISSFVIHDLKNLTYALSLTLNNAEEHMDNPEFQKDMIESIRNTLLKMKILMEKLQSLPEKQSLNTTRSDVHLLAQETANEMGRLRHDVSITFQGAPVISIIDEDEIKKVIVNLIINAADAADGSGTIAVETGIEGHNGYISVTDNGAGITRDFIENHLFKPFRTTKSKGLGIGLYQCKQVVEAHGGSITVKSEPGVRTVFTVHLPVADAPDKTIL